MSYVSEIRLQVAEDAQENAPWYRGDASAPRIYLICRERPAEQRRSWRDVYRRPLSRRGAAMHGVETVELAVEGAEALEVGSAGVEATTGTAVAPAVSSTSIPGRATARRQSSPVWCRGRARGPATRSPRQLPVEAQPGRRAAGVPSWRMTSRRSRVTNTGLPAEGLIRPACCHCLSQTSPSTAAIARRLTGDGHHHQIEPGTVGSTVADDDGRPLLGSGSGR